jgi:membrane associated rhomboid family serine protease
MLEDRDYMRQSSHGPYWSATIALLAANILAFILQYTVLTHEIFQNYLALSLDGLRHGYVWQLLTYQFLHGGLFHIFFNCWALFVFGREVESMLGKTRFLILYFSSGIVGGLFQALVELAWPNYFFGSTVGASAGVFGVVSAFAMLFPDRQLTMLLFLILPVNLRARSLLIVNLVLTALGISFPNTFLGGNVAHAAHLGGILTGLAFIRWGSFQNTWNPFPARKRKTNLIKTISFKMKPGPRTEDELPSEEFISREVDPILDKISQHGIQSLTERERKILEAARSKMAKR